MPPKKGKKGKGKGEAPPSFPIPRDLSDPFPADGVDGALGIGDLTLQERVKEVKAELTLWKISEAQRDGDLDLDLSDAALDELPDELFDLPWLQVLNLSRNRFVNSIFTELGGFTALRAVNLSTNLLHAALPDELITGLPPRLEELNLEENLITALPASMAALAELTWLSLRKNLLAALPPPCLQGWSKLTHLDLRDNKLKALPEELQACTSLESLLLTGNALDALPASIGGLKALKRLQVDRNALTSLPDSLGECTALEYLDFSYNKVGALPAPVCMGLTRLVRLSGLANKLSAIPAEIGAMLALQVLALSGNAIKALPVEVGALTELREIYLNGCPLTTLPPSVAAWTQLEEGVFHCKLKGLPPDIATSWGKCRLLDVRSKKKDTCKVPPELKDALPATRMVGIVLAKAKKGKK